MSDNVGSLERLAQLLERGMITREEFDREKQRLLSAPPAGEPVRTMGTMGQGASVDVAGMPESNMVWAILSTVFCCLPFGIVAIVKASQVESRWYMGDKEGAIEAAKAAATWSGIAAVVGLVLAILIVAMGGLR
jgi:hypothetical protein